MKLDEMFPSKYLKASTLESPILVTIRGCKMETMDDGARKPVLDFHETESSLVLNSTNGELVAEVCKSRESSDWIGKKIVVYVEPKVEFKGKLVPGLRVRAPKSAAKPEPEPDTTDDVEF